MTPWTGLLAGALGTLLLAQAAPALALSELKQVPGQQQQAQTQTSQATTPPTAPAPAAQGAPAELPQPDPLVNSGAAGGAAKTDDGKSVEIIYDVSKVPEPVRQMREKIVEAAASGDIERLRPLLTGAMPTQVTIGETTDDPVRSLRELSGDSDGIEILAILLDVLQTGFAHVGKGTPDEMYVWPYFTEKTLANLTAPEKVELLRIVTAGDYSDMLEFGGYNFYRVGITPKGDWKFFVAGD
ncbi:hypothetical protein P7F60_12995 [Rhizobium sp. YJ-22]|uniref:hypothetical protein n=1 Tax=Rhizobium sp. YJ-22 TaxID=3037556 RepID=UPI0024129A4A|nr:hypothetical protein [Rhizobium sp. YJ-22]MDG3577308.1 hypothetical protein [Rhizobium sp. YJ-22]